MFIPGPGRYKPANEMNPEGKYSISKWQSSRAKRFDPASSLRFPELSNIFVKLQKPKAPAPPNTPHATV